MSNTTPSTGAELALNSLAGFSTGATAFIDKNDIATILVSEIEDKLDAQFKENQEKRKAVVSEQNSLIKRIEALVKADAEAAVAAFKDIIVTALEQGGFTEVTTGFQSAYQPRASTLPTDASKKPITIPVTLNVSGKDPNGNNACMSFQLRQLPVSEAIQELDRELIKADEALPRLEEEAAVIRKRMSDMPKLERQARAKVALSSLRSTTEGAQLAEQLLKEIK